MKKNASQGLAELVAMRVLVGHWPEADYIIRSISVTYGEDVSRQARGILEVRRAEAVRELRELERRFGKKLAAGRGALTQDVAHRHDSGLGSKSARGGNRDNTKDAGASRRGAEG